MPPTLRAATLHPVASAARPRAHGIRPPLPGPRHPPPCPDPTPSSHFPHTSSHFPHASSHFQQRLSRIRSCSGVQHDRKWDIGSAAGRGAQRQRERLVDVAARCPETLDCPLADAAGPTFAEGAPSGLRTRRPHRRQPRSAVLSSPRLPCPTFCRCGPIGATESGTCSAESGTTSAESGTRGVGRGGGTRGWDAAGAARPELEPRGPGQRAASTAAVSATKRGLRGRSSTSTARPSPSARGICQFGYALSTPG